MSQECEHGYRLGRDACPCCSPEEIGSLRSRLATANEIIDEVAGALRDMLILLESDNDLVQYSDRIDEAHAILRGIETHRSKNS